MAKQSKPRLNTYTALGPSLCGGFAVIAYGQGWLLLALVLGSVAVTLFRQGLRQLAGKEGTT